jgi:hypothetical protein
MRFKMIPQNMGPKILAMVKPSNGIVVVAGVDMVNLPEIQILPRFYTQARRNGCGSAAQ